LVEPVEPLIMIFFTARRYAGVCSIATALYACVCVLIYEVNKKDARQRKISLAASL